MNKHFIHQSKSNKIRELVALGKKDKKKGLYSKRFNNRANNLELERKDALLEEYSERNCAVACYFCNNDKSDIISDKDYLKYFIGTRKKYINYLYKKFKNDINKMKLTGK